jgi:uncharacterized 2Fe-2S/4Fe-4S cluster protein (DUF4445 family)
MSKILAKKNFGVALDIGTTDIKGSLLDISSKKELARASVPNEQKAFGQDVITRLYFATKSGGLKELNKRAISAVNKLLSRLTEGTAVDIFDIKRIIAVGNSAMYHLMLMIRPDTLARAPFLPAEKKLQEKSANEAGIRVAKNAIFIFLPNISGFIGSDILASILLTGMHRDKKCSLIIDMGTNGEIALGSKDKIFVTSCASGPAFEARHIRCGMSARDGAIIRAELKNGKLLLRTIGDIIPKGISATGLIDIVSILIDKNIIDRKGRMKREKYIIYKGDGKKIYLTQSDIRQIQLAKAALSSGMEILKRRAEIEFKDLSRFYITGTLGGGINKANAKNIGLIPKGASINKVKFLKDGALSGAKKFLLEEAFCKNEINSILAKCEHIELHKDREFEEVFAGAMGF